MRPVDADVAPVYLNSTACVQIQKMPTLDVEVVTHCEDCFWYNQQLMFCRAHQRRFTPDFYCKLGKPKED